jgi:hypothetical protein
VATESGPAALPLLAMTEPNYLLSFLISEAYVHVSLVNEFPIEDNTDSATLNLHQQLRE